MRQMDYGFNQPLGIPGGIFDLSRKDIATRTLDAGMSSKPGMGLVIGATAGETVKPPAAGETAAQFEGVFVHGSANLEQDMDGIVAAKGGTALGVMKRGRIWGIIAPTATTTYGKAVALIISGKNVGKFTDSGDAAETPKVTLTGAKFIGKADADNLIAVVELG